MSTFPTIAPVQSSVNYQEKGFLLQKKQKNVDLAPRLSWQAQRKGEQNRFRVIYPIKKIMNQVAYKKPLVIDSN
ncbi:hypothetical protein BK142_04820 [Paenibacillus glucanolyticus]|nr:hypothetical protein BK142_04820 [Paenibacillus glucanolyticus]